MYLVNKLYIKFTDDDGHSYLINKDKAAAFEVSVDRIYESFVEHKDDDLYYEEYNNLLEDFGCIRVEGEELFTVLPEDVAEENKWKDVAVKLINQVDKLGKGEITSIVIPQELEDFK